MPVGEVALALGCLLDRVFGGSVLESARRVGGLWRVLVVRQDKFHTCGGPRRRPGLGEGRGRRIQNSSRMLKEKLQEGSTRDVENQFVSTVDVAQQVPAKPLV